MAIILDPARTTGFKSEATKDGAAYALALGLLKRSFGGVVAVLHNSGYDRTRERGSTTLGDACDQVFNIIKKPGGVRVFTAGRLRDDPDEDDALMNPDPSTGQAQSSRRRDRLGPRTARPEFERLLCDLKAG